jgi:parallel beta-helix repeat protein
MRHFFRQMKQLMDLGQKGTGGQRKAKRSAFLSLESLEDRMAPAIFSVTNTLDSGAGSLRQAILNADANPGVLNTIDFAIAGSGVQTINVLSTLPSLTSPTILDGTTQSGYAGKPLVRLSGTSAGANSVNGLVVTAGGTLIRGLDVTGFSGMGILLSGNGADVLTGNYVGIDPTGTTAAANTFGIVVDGVNNDTISGNVISGNTAYGLTLAAASTNTVSNNLIGTNAAENAAVGNGSVGVVLELGSTNNNVTANVLAGNGAYGALVTGTGTLNNTLSGNYVGLVATALPNGIAGIALTGGTRGNVIGGTTAAARNFISGNTVTGIDIQDAGTSNNYIEYNYVGLNLAGTAAVANGQYGVEIQGGASANLVAVDWLSGNGQDGVLLTGAGTSGNVVGSCFIGTDATGTVALGNGAFGVLIQAGASNNIIEISLITANPTANVELTDAGTTGNVIEGNIIGTNRFDNAPLGNNGVGVLLAGGASGNTVGGATTSLRNVISGNNSTAGVEFSGTGTTGNQVLGNIVGSNTSGTPITGNTGGNTVSGNSISLTVTPAALPSATLNVPINATLNTVGGTGAYTYAVSSGTLPTWLSLNTNTGALTGTPNSTGTFNFTITATDSTSATLTGSDSCTLVVNGVSSLTVSPSTLSNATANSLYSVTLGASGGSGSYSFAVTTGTLPSWLSLSGGVLSGTPTTTGTSASFTITATDTNNSSLTGTVAYTVTVNAASTLTVSPSTLATATANSAYSATLSATGGSGTYTYAVTSGTLPSWLTLSGGVLSGTPTTSGTSASFTITATDSANSSLKGSRAYTVTVNAASSLTESPTTLAAATANSAYSATLSATGGSGTYTYAVTSGTLPSWLTLSGGVLSGTPTTSGTSASFTITATDSANSSLKGSRAYTVTVNAASSLTVSPATLAAATANSAYSATLGATGGSGTYTFAVTAGSLPSWLSLSGGVLSGTPTTSGTSTSFTITATDTANSSLKGSQAYTVTINLASSLTVSPTTLSNATANSAYSVTLSATGGAGTYTYSVTAGTLPSWLTLSGGVLSGTPTTTGTSASFTITAKDTAHTTLKGSRAYTVTVNAASSLTVSPTSLPGATTNTAYSTTLSATGGSGSYTYAVTSGSLPSWLTLSAGVLSGTPTSTGTSASFTITATDTANSSLKGSQAYTVTVTASSGHTYYVATTGNDNNSGTVASPFATLQHAMISLLPGDTLDVEAGSYAGFIVGWDSIPANSTGDQYGLVDGTASAPITIRADPAAAPGSVIINARNNETAAGIDLEPGDNYINISGFVIDDTSSGITQTSHRGEGIKIAGSVYDSASNCTIKNIVYGFGIIADNANNVVLQNNTISGTGNQGDSDYGHAIYLSGSTDGAVVKGNILYNNAYIGLHVNGDLSEGGNGLVTNAVIEDNYIYNNGQNGINCDGLQSSLIENNLIYGYQNYGIVLYQIDAAAGSKNNVIVNNTIVSAVSGAGAALRILDASTGNTVLNNILLGGGGVALRISSDSMSGLVCNFNIGGGVYQSEDTGNTQTLAQWQSSTSQDANSFTSTASALFVNAGSNNYQLSATSPAINAGTSTDAPSTDIMGNTRPSGGGYDVGAYQ